MSRKPLTDEEGNIRELLEEDFALARPIAEVEPEFLRRFEEEKAKRLRGRPTGRSKSAVTISLDQDLLQQLRNTGSGWQSRVNALLRAAMGLSEPSSAS